MERKANMERKIAIVGLGYAGLHTAMAFGKKKQVIGFDKDQSRIHELMDKRDRNNEYTAEELGQTKIQFTSDPNALAAANFYIIIVPTPINQAKEPDFQFLTGASEIVGKYLKKGDIVVFESTVYPGATEEHCLPVLEKVSHLKLTKDFSLGYSPERINPGDHQHTFNNTIKIVSGSDVKALDIIAKEYGDVVAAGVYRLSSIKAAEAVKVIENTQRDMNIAFMNELSQLFHRLGLDSVEILAAAKTKWNFIPYQPGLVGGHCIGVDPYYLIHKANEVNFNLNLISAARSINDHMGKYIAEETIKLITQKDLMKTNRNIAVFGITYKEDCPDIRNSKVVDIIRELENYNLKVFPLDPLADKLEVEKEYGLTLFKIDNIPPVAAIILAVPHQEFNLITPSQYAEHLIKGGVIIDIKGVLNLKDFEKLHITIWRS